MKSFLQSTSAHGIPHLGSSSRFRKAFWGLVCVCSYIAMAWAVVQIFQKFKDPRNLKQIFSIEKACPLMKNGSMVFPKVYPRFVLCAQDPWSNLNRHDNISIRYFIDTSNDKSSSQKLPPLELTYLEPMFEGDNHTFGSCSALNVNSTDFEIIWNGVNASFLLYFSMIPGKEPFLNRRLGSGTSINIEVSSRIKSIRVHVSKIDVFELLGGSTSDYANDYPHNLGPIEKAYDENYCLNLIKASYHKYCDAFVLGSTKRAINFTEFDFDWVPSPISNFKYDCKKFNQSLRSNDYLINEYDQWADDQWYSGHDEYDRYYTYYDDGDYSYDKMDESDESTKSRQQKKVNQWAAHKCKPNSLKLSYELTNITEYVSSDVTSTQVSLLERVMQIMTCKESRAMEVSDLLSQIGGFLGLLIGASVMTVVEVFELLISFGFRYLTKLFQAFPLLSMKASLITGQHVAALNN